MITIAIADNNKSTLLQTKQLLHQLPKYKVVMEASNGKELVQKLHAAKTLPNIVMLELAMLPGDGFVTLNYISTEFPSIKSIAFSNHLHKHIIENAISEGFIGILNKQMLTQNFNLRHDNTSLLQKINQCLQTVYENDFYYDADVDIEIENLNIPKSTKEIIGNLSLSEKLVQILRLMVMKFCNEEIGKIISRSKHQAKKYCMQVEHFFGETDRLCLMQVALQMGLIKPVQCLNKL